jgi:prepilin signal peptidase PulO-like enzyme (type II secretory pathway)
MARSKFIRYLPIVILLLLAATIILTVVVIISVGSLQFQLITLGLIIIITIVASMVALTTYVMLERKEIT